MSHSPMLGHAGVTHQNRLRYKNISQPQAFCGISIMSDISKKHHEQEGVQKLEITLTKSIFVQKSGPKQRPKSGNLTVTVFKP